MTGTCKVLNMAPYDTLPILKHLDVLYIWCFHFLYLFHLSTYIEDVANEVFHVVASCIDSHSIEDNQVNGPWIILFIRGREGNFFF